MRRITETVPIVCPHPQRPDRLWVWSRARHAAGTNVTGILFRLEGLTGKQLEIAKDVLPGGSPRWIAGQSQAISPTESSGGKQVRRRHD